MLRIILPLPILGFVIFLMVDSGNRFQELKDQSPEDAKDYERQYALLMTLLVILAIVLVAAMIYAYKEYQKSGSFDLNLGWAHKGKTALAKKLARQSTLRLELDEQPLVGG